MVVARRGLGLIVGGTGWEEVDFGVLHVGGVGLREKGFCELMRGRLGKMRFVRGFELLGGRFLGPWRRRRRRGDHDDTMDSSTVELENEA